MAEIEDVSGDTEIMDHEMLVDHSSQHEQTSESDILTVPTKGRKFFCTECDKNYSSSYNLSKHIREKHGHFKGNRNYSTLLCSLCEKELLSKVSYENHLLAVHDLCLEKEQLTFASEKEFYAWKDDMEKQTVSIFIKNTGSHKLNGTKFTYYYCHRSGKARDVACDKRQRHLKILGSSKINKTCPAMIKVRETSTFVEVDFIKTHVGHSVDSLGILKLSDKQKKGMASKLQGEVPVASVLNELHDSGVNRIEKVHLITRDEISLIRYEFKTFIEGNKIADGEENINTWVSNMNDDENSPIILFKPRNVYSDIFTGLNENDFMVIIMNQSQREALQTYGNDVICIDFEQVTCTYHYYVTSILVLDSKKKAYPAAFIISNRHDTVALTVAFDSIKEQGIHISPKIFLSNNTDCFLDAWDFVFGLPKKHYLCSWDADDCWRKKLNNMVPKNDHAKLYKMLYSLLVETDVETFKILLSTSVKLLVENPVTERFGKFFLKNFAIHPEVWAYCYRKWSELDTYMHMERMHKTLRYMFLEGKHIKRIDKTVYFLLKFIKDEVFEKLVTREKIAAKSLEIASCHENSLSLPEDSLCQNGDEWLVASQSKVGDVYFIKEGEPCSSDCDLICVPCGFCLHRFVCSCNDSKIQKNMCKHIHLLGRTLKSSENSPSHELDSPADSPAVADSPESLLDSSSLLNSHDKASNSHDSISSSHNIVTHDSIHSIDVGLQLVVDATCEETLDSWEEIIPIDSVEQFAEVSESIDEIKNTVLDMHNKIGQSIEDCTSVSDYRALHKVMEIALKSFQNYKNSGKRKTGTRKSPRKSAKKRIKL